jgi:ELWxxDGT repeat protein
LYAAAESTVYFGVNDSTHGNELWKTDGTTAGTTLVKDIWPGPHFSLGYPAAGRFGVLNDQFYFTADDGTHGEELWRTDGTAAGTILVKDIWPGPVSADVHGLTILNGQLLFVASDPAHGPELWRTDGTRAGTLLIRNIHTGTRGSNELSLSSGFGALHGTTCFSTYDFVHGYRLWRTDGTREGTTVVKDLGPPNGLYAGGPGPFTAVGDYLYFAEDDRVHGGGLWKTDGTEAGTILVSDLGAGGHAFPDHLTNYNGTLYFSDGNVGTGLWKSDGTAAGTVLVKAVGSIFMMTQANGLLFILASSRSQPLSLWVSDGTTAGTSLLMQVSSYQVPPPEILQVVGNVVFFGADTPGGGWGLWKTDGTSQGTVLVSDVGPAEGWPNSTQQAAVNGVLYYLAYDGVSGIGLWKSNGTPEGTILLKDSMQSHWMPDILINFNGTLFFTANDSTYGRELWKTDGTPDGTILVADINPNPGAAPLDGLTVANGLLFFSADDGRHGRELWQSDGTTAGTRLVLDIRKEGSSAPSWLSYVNGSLFFMADDGRHGTEPWVLHFPTSPLVSPGLAQALETPSDSGARELTATDSALQRRTDLGSRTSARRLAERDAWFARVAKTKTDIAEPTYHHTARHGRPADGFGDLVLG